MTLKWTMGRPALLRTFYRLVKNNPATAQDVLSQAALRRPPPRTDADFLRKWEGLSVFDNEAAARRIGRQRRWKIGEYIATLEIPDDAPLSYSEPDVQGSGHWLLYDAHGRMLDEKSAPYVLRCIVRIVHGPSTTDEVAGG